jgi:hypothetical protein
MYPCLSARRDCIIYMVDWMSRTQPPQLLQMYIWSFTATSLAGRGPSIELISFPWTPAIMRVQARILQRRLAAVCSIPVEFRL